VKLSSIALASIASLALSAPAFAHHSGAMFDRDKELKLEGTIKSFGWTNPHSWIEINVTDTQGQVETWGVECNSPNNLARMGWRSTSFKPGDKVTISIHPLRTGERGGSFMKAVFADGKVLGETARAGPAAAPAKSQY
jgi:hypothetical protein